jgi:hypothetical protein
MHRLIDLIGDEVGQGRRFAGGETVSGILEGHGVRFLDVARRHYPEYFGVRSQHYEGDDFPVLQCLWPDKQGRFPTDAGFPESLRPLQPVLVR